MSWKKGQSGNSKGRPRSGHSLADAIRRKVDPEQFVEELLKIAATSPSDQTRLRAMEMLMERGWKKPAQTIEVGPVTDYDELSDEELQALEEETVAELADVEARLLPSASSTLDGSDHASGRSEGAASPSPERLQRDTCSTLSHTSVPVGARVGVLVRKRVQAIDDISDT